MQTIKMTTGARAYLVANGFEPVKGRKDAGLECEWTHKDGRKANVGFGLFSKTGQSSRGAGAVWGYTIEII